MNIPYFLILFYSLLRCSLGSNYSTSLVFTSAPTSYWSSVTSSYSGQYLAATTLNTVYTSSNYGYDWIEASSNAFNSIASSSSGENLCATGSDGIYLSSNFGVTWNVSYASQYSTTAIASSENGQYLFAVGSYISVSKNYGLTWSTNTSAIHKYSSVACSSSGQYVVVGVNSGIIYMSRNYGVSFQTAYNFKQYWVGVAISSNGQYVSAVGGTGGFVVLSNNYGITWSNSNSGGERWTAIAMSGDGSIQVVVASNIDGSVGCYSFSEDYGLSWTIQYVNYFWNAVTMSKSGQYVTATIYDGGICTTEYSPTSMPSSPPTTIPSPSPVFQQYSYTLVETESEIRAYTSLVASSTGQYIYATESGFGVFRSSNYGNSLTVSLNIAESWSSISCTNSGQLVYATLNSGPLYRSNNYGLTWNTTSNAAFAVSNAMVVVTSGNGQYVYVVCHDFTNAVYISTSNGSTFTLGGDAGQYSPSSMSCSDSGQYVTLATQKYIYWSNNYANSFQALDLEAYWTSIAMSVSGQYQIIASAVSASVSGQLYVSNNFGQSFELASLSSQYTDFTPVAIDGSGAVMFAAVPGSNVFFSLNYGVTWTSTNSPPGLGYTALATSNNSEFLAALVYDGGFYTNQFKIPTSMPSSSPSTKPSNQPSMVPSVQPTSQPSLQPHTSFPTSQPSSCPSSLPTAQPSSYPTYMYEPYNLYSASVESSGPNNSFVFNNLGCGTHAFITASILVSYLDSSTSGAVSIVVESNGKRVIVSNACAPPTLCGSVVCAVNVNVTSVIDCSGGGSLTILASTVNASQQTGADTLCSYKGTPNLQFAMAYTVSVNPQPTARPTFAPTLEGPGDFVFEASPNTPFYVIVLFILLFIALGVFLVRLRDKSGGLFSEVTIMSTCIDLALVGYHLTSEVLYIIVLFSENLNILGGIIVGLRLLSLIPSSYFLLVTFGPPIYSHQYGTMLNKQHLFKNASIYTIVIIVMMLEQSLVRYLPWNSTNYTLQSRGFPDQFILTVCMMSKLFQLFSTLVVQIVVLAYSDAYLFKNGSDDIALALVLLYLISSVLTVTLFAITNFLRLRVGKDFDHTTKVEDAKIKVNNPIHHVEEARGTEMISRPSELPLGDRFVKYSYLQEREALLKEEWDQKLRQEKEAWDYKLNHEMEERKQLALRLMELESRLKS